MLTKKIREKVSASIDRNGHMKSTWKPTTARGRSHHFNSSIPYQMVHICQKLVNIIHLVAVSEDSARLDQLITQLEQLRGGVTPTRGTLTLEYLFFAHYTCDHIKKA